MKKSAMLGVAMLAGLAFAGNSQAADEDECAIWICLPGAFPETCEAAKSAMKSRVSRGRSPLPSFSACSADGTSHGMSSNYGPAAYIPERKVCKNWVSTHRDYYCSSWETQPERYVKGQRCRHAPGDADGMIPEGCTRTGRYVEVFDASGEQQGDTYFW